MKISYINAVSQLCEQVGAEIENVAKGMGLDSRIGQAFLNAGIGYGGSCFPKDVSAFIKIAEKNGVDFQMLRATEAVNQLQRSSVVRKCEEALGSLKGKKVAVWGLAFKPETDDLRNAPSIDILSELYDKEAVVVAYDPVAMDKMKSHHPHVTYAKNPLEACENADVLLILTEWEAFKKISLSNVKKKLKRPLIVDGRNMCNVETLKKLGFTYYSIGRPAILRGKS